MSKSFELKFRRKAAGYTQKEFATLLGVNERTVKNWENGSIPAGRLDEVAEHLGVDVYELFLPPAVNPHVIRAAVKAAMVEA